MYLTTGKENKDMFTMRRIALPPLRAARSALRIICPLTTSPCSIPLSIRIIIERIILRQVSASIELQGIEITDKRFPMHHGTAFGYSIELTAAARCPL